jgi:TolB protein
MKRRRFVLSIVVAIASAATAQDTAAWKTCTNDEYGVSFQYPNQWQRSDRYSDIEFEGANGSVQVDASEGTSLKLVCQGAATHKLRPYGEHPHIEMLKVRDRRACIVWPSADQGEPHLAQLIVEYPSPVRINGDRYKYMVMYADKDHIRLISNTLHFLPAPDK